MKIERSTVHISDDAGRMAMLEKRTYEIASNDNNTEKVLIRYIYSNHPQSASLELDENGAIISYEEYHPYGTTAYQAKNDNINALAKRYRYTGKERDEESGLYYHGARYYIPWLCRWTACDPLESKYSPQSPYVYCSDNPVNRVDPSGMGDDDPKQPSSSSTQFKPLVYLGKNSLMPLQTTDNARDVRSAPMRDVPSSASVNYTPSNSTTKTQNRPISKKVSNVDNAKDVRSRQPQENITPLTGFWATRPIEEYKRALSLPYQVHPLQTLVRAGKSISMKKQQEKRKSIIIQCF